MFVDANLIKAAALDFITKIPPETGLNVRAYTKPQIHKATG